MRATVTTAFEYDQGGNRQVRTQRDPSTSDVITRTEYTYDTDDVLVDCDPIDGSSDTLAAECYGTMNNRLMAYERQVWVASVGIFRRAEAVWYQYEVNGAAAGNTNYIVHKFYNPNQPFQQPFCRAFYLHYDDRGELWFVARREWQQGPNLDCSVDAQTTSVREFRASGRAMRFTADRTTGGGDILESTRVWHDYDGDEIYADVRIAFEETMQDFTVTEIASHEPGIGSHDGSEAVYSHGDQIGSMRMLTYEGAAVGRQAVYTAFGERVWQDGSIGATRYQYAGAWGYQTFPEHTGQPGDELPFIHVGHRWYDPSTGRFLQRDPIGVRGGPNVYEYLRNSPTSAVDPSGLDRWYVRYKRHSEVWIYDPDSCQYIAYDFGPDPQGPIWACGGFIPDKGNINRIPHDAPPIGPGRIDRFPSTPKEDREDIQRIERQRYSPPTFSLFNIGGMNCMTWAWNWAIERQKCDCGR